MGTGVRYIVIDMINGGMKNVLRKATKGRQG